MEKKHIVHEATQTTISIVTGGSRGIGRIRPLTLLVMVAMSF